MATVNVNVLPPQNPMKRPKKKSKNQIHWKRNSVKRARITGTAYVNDTGNVIPAKLRQEHQCICDPPCVDKFTPQEMDFIFESYRKLTSHEEQTLFLRGCVLKCGEDNHAHVNEYRFNPGLVSIRVCQKFFLGLLNIKRSRLRKKVLNLEANVLDGRGRHGSQKRTHPSALLAARTFLNTLAARPSHYSRKDNNQRSYLESNLSISALYNRFITENPDYSPYNVLLLREEPKSLKKWMFEKIFNYEYNISFGYPRSEICDWCEHNSTEQKVAVLKNDPLKLAQLKTDHDAHLDLADGFYRAMSKQTIGALPNDTACLCFDFEKNFALPVTNVTREFFSRQLWLYNFGIHNLKEGHASMYTYSETFAKKGPNEVISALRHYIETCIPPNITKLHLFSDNSGGQNKNKYLVAYLSSLGRRFQEIILNFPVVGHSRMPCDRDFARIEKLKKTSDKFHFPSDYVKLIQRAQPSLPFKVVYLEHPLTDDLRNDGNEIAMVFDFKAVLEPILRPPTGIMSYKGFRFDANGNIVCRAATSGPFPTIFEIRKGNVTVPLLRSVINLVPTAYDNFIPVSKAKFENIHTLLNNIVIPMDKIFYETVMPED